MKLCILFQQPFIPLCKISTALQLCGYCISPFYFPYRLSDSTIENARLMTQSLSMDGKFDIRVSTFGTSSSSILIHVERTGTKSLTRKQKD